MFCEEGGGHPARLTWADAMSVFFEMALVKCEFVKQHRGANFEGDRQTFMTSLTRATAESIKAKLTGRGLMVKIPITKSIELFDAERTQLSHEIMQAYDAKD